MYNYEITVVQGVSDHFGNNCVLYHFNACYWNTLFVDILIKFFAFIQCQINYKKTNILRTQEQLRYYFIWVVTDHFKELRITSKNDAKIYHHRIFCIKNRLSLYLLRHFHAFTNFCMIILQHFVKNGLLKLKDCVRRCQCTAIVRSDCCD